jgi:general secretion pathway protein N
MRIKRTVVYVILGVAAYVAALIATWPAAVAYRWFDPGTANVKVYGIGGTIWDGHAGIELNSISFDKVAWGFRPLSLLSASLGYRVTASSETANLDGIVTMTPGGELTIDGMQGMLPVTAFAAWLPLPRHSLSGMLHVNLQHTEFEHGNPLSADGVIDLHDTRLLWPMSLALGDYRLTLDTGDKAIHLGARDQNGPLLLQASGLLSPAGDYTISGTLAPRDESNTKIKQALDSLGKADARGRYHFSFSGQW